MFARAVRVDVSVRVTMDVEVPTAAELRKLRVVDLRKRLQSLELTQSGEN